MTRFKNLFYKSTAIICFAILLGCTYTQTFQPQFNDNQTAIVDSINAKYSFENINVDGKKTSGSGGNHSTLTVKFINGKNIPTNDDSVTVITKALALQIKKTLKDPQQFDSYTILFVTRTVDGSTTTEKNFGHEFKATELE